MYLQQKKKKKRKERNDDFFFSKLTKLVAPAKINGFLSPIFRKSGPGDYRIRLSVIPSVTNWFPGHNLRTPL